MPLVHRETGRGREAKGTPAAGQKPARRELSVGSDGSGVWQVVTTTDSEEDAQRLADGLIEQRLAACVQVDGPIRSTYWWEGGAVTAPERRLTLKTSADRYEQMEHWLLAQHSQDGPEPLATELCCEHSPSCKWVVS